jgi:serine/threonine protein kinase
LESLLLRCAVKKLAKRFTKSGEVHATWHRSIRHEIDVDNVAGNSQNILQLIGAFEDDSNVFLVTELCTGVAA